MTNQTTIRLRPLTQEDAAPLEAARTLEADPYNWPGFRDPGGLAEDIAARRTLHEDGGVLAVTAADGELLGDVSWRLVRTGPSVHSWCWNIGIALLPDHRGKGYGVLAQRSLVEYLFAQTPAQRIEASTDADNVAEQRALEKAGFTREGVLRGAQWRGGRWHDLVSYSILRDDSSRR